MTSSFWLGDEMYWLRSFVANGAPQDDTVRQAGWKPALPSFAPTVEELKKSQAVWMTPTKSSGPWCDALGATEWRVKRKEEAGSSLRSE
jgi:hypothetical protein